MSNQKRKSLDEFSDESEQFESQFEQLFEGEGEESARKRLLKEIVEWLQASAKQGRFIPLASADRRAFRSLLERWNSRLRRKGFHVEGIDYLYDFDPNAGVVLTGECPYPGLDPYTHDRRYAFFGREELVSSCVSHLERQGHQILMIVGASGAGKSSVALAGILPRLMELHGEAWLFGPRFTPGAHPLAELAKSVAQAIGKPDQATGIQRHFSAEPDKALGRLAELCRNKSHMLIIDQFEELLTLCHDESEQRNFAQVLCALTDPSASANGFFCRVLLTLRTDHLARFEENNALSSLHMRLVKENNLFYLSAIGFKDIKRAIKEPADMVGLRFIPEDLIDQLASQTASLSNGLPLLQFSLRRLWDTRPQNESGEPLDLVTENMVKDLPDVQQALGAVAEDVFGRFSPPQKEVCDRLLQELLVLDETFEEPLRRRRKETELVKVLQDRFPKNPGDVIRVIDEFIAAGLLRRFGNVPNSQVEVSHEALLRHWDHIYRIITGADVKDRLHLIKKIERETLDWLSHDQSIDYLGLKGDRLKLACRYAKDGWLADAAARAYVDACMLQVEEDRRKDEAAKRAESRLVQFRYGFLLALFVLALTIVLFLLHKKSETERFAQASDLVSYGFYYLQADDAKNAEKKFKDAKDLVQEHSIVARLGLGLICLDNKSYEEAKNHFEEVIFLTEEKEKQGESKKDPTLYTYYYRKGISFRELGKYAEAKDAFKKAIELMKKRNPNDKNITEYYCQLGFSYLYLDEIEDSEKTFNEGIRLGKEMPPKGPTHLFRHYEACNQYGLGQLSMRKRNFKAARDNFENAIKALEHIEPAIPTYKLSLAQASLGVKDYPAAEKECRDAITNPNLMPNEKGKAYTLLGNALAEQGKYPDAIGAFSKAIETKPNDAFVALYLSDALNENNNRSEAEKYLKKAEENARRDPQLKEKDAQDFFSMKLAKLKDKLSSQQ